MIQVNDNLCGNLDANSEYINKIKLVTFSRNHNQNQLIKIEKDAISKVYEALESLNSITYKNDSNKVFHAGGIGELMVCSMLKLDLLTGTTTRGADAVLLDKSNVSNFMQEGRYQIKYRDERTSDIEFRIDVDDNGHLLLEYAWDFLLIATHPTRDKKYNNGVFSIKPNNFYLIPFEYAVKLSQDLNGGSHKKSNNGQNRYLKFRINWTFNRSGKGNVGSKMACIEKYFRLNVPQNLEFNDVTLITR
jgi:hypothetical protein